MALRLPSKKLELSIFSSVSPGDDDDGSAEEKELEWREQPRDEIENGARLGRTWQSRNGGIRRGGKKKPKQDHSGDEA